MRNGEPGLYRTVCSMHAKLEILALVLGFIGLVGTITITALPTWRVSAFIGANLIVMEELREGLWMNCFRQMDIRMQCKVYDSLLILPRELQAARALVCVSIALEVIALVVTICGTQKSMFCRDKMKTKNILLAVGGSLYLLSCLLTLIPVSWVANTVIRNFYNPLLPDSRKRELGDALFIGWATSGVLLVTGILLLFRCSKRRLKDETYNEAFLMTGGNVTKEGSGILLRSPSGSYKHQEYV